jgi:hypothetical protein
LQDVEREPTAEEMQKDYKEHCEPFTYNGYQFFYHQPGCGCYNCTKTRMTSIAKPEEIARFHCVTFSNFETNRHWYQSMQTIYTKEQAANRCIGMAGGAIGRR